jgi:catechol 2,3-dioxygenase-like lactoylglutathione lyase family enzyme
MIRHISSMADIVDDLPGAVRHYRDVLGMPVEDFLDRGYAIVKVPGVLHFGLWTRKAAAKHTFGDAARDEEIPLGFAVGFEVDSVGEAVEQMSARGFTFVQQPHKEPWGQVTARFFSPSGALCEVSETPWERKITQDLRAAGDESADGSA